MNISRHKLRAIASLLLPAFLALMACSNYLRVQDPGDGTPIVAGTETLAETPTPTSVPDTPTPDLEMTRASAFSATSQAIENDVATQGAELYSFDWNSRVQGTLQALGMLEPTDPPTPIQTPVLFPFPVTTTEVEVDGGLRTVIKYTLDDPSVLQAAREPMLRYMDFIRFSDGFPAEGVAEQLAEYLERDHIDLGAGSCTYSKMLEGIHQLQWKGDYLRLTTTGEVIFEEDYSLRRLTADTDIELVQGWHINGIKIERVDIKTGEVLQTESFPQQGGSFSVRYDTSSQQWILFDDDSNTYCHGLFLFD
jgi:hypothetical protein